MNANNKDQIKTKFNLLMAFANREPIALNGYQFQVINKLEHEDGSGRSFNAHGLLANGQSAWTHVYTID